MKWFRDGKGNGYTRMSSRENLEGLCCHNYLKQLSTVQICSLGSKGSKNTFDISLYSKPFLAVMDSWILLFILQILTLFWVVLQQVIQSEMAQLPRTHPLTCSSAPSKQIKLVSLDMRSLAGLQVSLSCLNWWSLMSGYPWVMISRRRIVCAQSQKAKDKPAHYLTKRKIKNE